MLIFKDKKSIESILSCWFGELENGHASAAQRKRWYSGGKAFDQQIATQFADTLALAALGHCQTWLNTPRGNLALIILFDQFSRHIFRGSAQAFAYDEVALQLCLQGITQGTDKALQLDERLFFYHPLQHAEDLYVQQQSVALMKAMLVEYPQHQDYLQRAMQSVTEHHDIIRQFGRFPHRNQVLNRDTTAEELAYLASGAKRFGQ